MLAANFGELRYREVHGMLIYPIAPVLLEVGLEKVTSTRTGSRARVAGGRGEQQPSQ
jgi:hypothetical protein